jgi:hypothetical protein
MGDGLLFGDDGFEPVQTPLIGLVEIDLRTEVHPREQPVGVTAECVLAVGMWADLVTQHRRQLAVGACRCRRAFL